MNARKLCLTLLLIGGPVLTAHAADTGAVTSGLQQALATIQQEQVADFHRRSLDEFPQRDIAVAEAGFAATDLAQAAIVEAENAIRLQGRLALWSIEEEVLVGFRTGQLAQCLSRQEYGVAVAAAGSRSDSPLDKARGLLKTARFEWPEFVPASLR